jgi:hypothetical protein
MRLREDQEDNQLLYLLKLIVYEKIVHVSLQLSNLLYKVTTILESSSWQCVKVSYIENACTICREQN